MDRAQLYPSIETPALVIDLDIVDANVKEMADITLRHGVRLRPHTKTHKMPELARCQIDAGAGGITCSTLGEAEVMADGGCTDIHVVTPLWGATKAHRLMALREKSRVIMSLDSVAVGEQLGRVGRESGSPVEVMVNVDTGDHRVGLAPCRATADLVAQLMRIRGITVLGLFTHAGHAYLARSSDELAAIAQREAGDLIETAELCRREGIEIREISPGTTPIARIVTTIPGVTENRPGTYIFNNTKMIRLGMATEETCAMRVIGTVVARPTDERVVVDTGGKVLTYNEVGVAGFITDVGHPELHFETLAVDVAVAHLPASGSTDRTSRIEIGDRLEILPSCSVVDQFEVAHFVRGGEVVETVPIRGRGKVT
jgi:D-serine deaminase-like pyridoxal phosphate-dependent protein